MIRLSQKEFVTALKKGLGRASLHVKEYGLDDVADLVLEACLHSQNYDAQCECSRAPWLWGMFCDSPHYPRFRSAILAALKTESNAWDAQQLCRLAKEMVIHGDETAQAALEEFVFKQASQTEGEDWIGADEWIELKGINGALKLARIYGQRLIYDTKAWPNELYYLNDEMKEEFDQALRQHALTDEKLQTYIVYREKRKPANLSLSPEERKAKARQEFRENHSLEQIIADANNGVGKFPAIYLRFGRLATPEELEQVYTLLLKETRDSVRVRLLWVFYSVPLPRLNNAILEWVLSQNEELRRATLAALSQISDSRVHDLAKSKIVGINVEDSDSEVLDLFVHNYQREDAPLIMQFLASGKPEMDVDLAHSLGFRIRDIAENHLDEELSGPLMWAYENTPCSNCRHEVVVLLKKFQHLNDTLIQECLHDVDEETRLLVQ